MTAQETNVANSYESTLSGSLSAGATTINVTSTTGTPVVPFYVVIDPDSDAKREVVLVDDSKTAATFVLSAASKRGVDGTTDVAHDAGAVVGIYPVAALWVDINDRVDATLTSATHGTEDHSTALGTAVLSDLSDVSVTVPSSGEVLEWDGAAWAPAAAGGGDHGATTGLGDDDHTQYLNTTRHDADDHSDLNDFFTFAQTGTLAVGTGTVRFYPPYAMTVQDVTASVGTAPTGAALIVDVNKNGTTIFGTQSNRPQIAVSTFTDLSGAPSVTALTTSDYVTVDIDQVGSTVAGSDLTVVVRYKRA